MNFVLSACVALICEEENVFISITDMSWEVILFIQMFLTGESIKQYSKDSLSVNII